MNAAQTLQKIQNQKTLLQIIRREEKISQAALAAATGFQPSTVSYLVRDLKEKRLLRVAGKGESGRTGGKRSDLLSLNRERGVALGMQLRQDGFLLNAVDFDGGVIRQDMKRFDEPDEDGVTGLIAGEILEKKREFGERFIGAGIAVSSVVNSAGDILVSADFGWKIRRFNERLREMLPGIHLVIENDANCAALYSYSILNAGFRNLLAFIIFPGMHSLGAGIILDGKLYRGTTGAAGEILKSVNDVFEPRTVARYVLSAANLLDTEAIVLSGEILDGNDREFFGTLEAELKNGSDRFAVHIMPEREAAVTGAAFLCTTAYIDELLQGGT